MHVAELHCKSADQIAGAMYRRHLPCSIMLLLDRHMIASERLMSSESADIFQKSSEALAFLHMFVAKQCVSKEGASKRESVYRIC